jgi:M6 family metalloprotease-like protein
VEEVMKATKVSAAVLLCAATFAFQVAWAMPPRPGIVMTQAGLDELVRLGVNGPKDPVRDAGKRGIVNHPGDVTPLVTGTKQFPVIAIKFSNFANQYTSTDFQNMLFGTWTSGSARDYYHEVSYNQFNLTGTVAGWYTSANVKSYYGYSNGFARAAALAKEAAVAADPSVDFSLSDNDGDGYVDVFTCVHAGFGYEESGDGTDIWSHKWDFTSAGIGAYTTNDAWPGHSGQYIKINTYTIDPERSNYSNNGTMACIGVFCHEWGHGLGLPDLYDVDGGGEGLGNWSVMAAGSWGGDGNSPYYPVHPDAWSKLELGWLNPTAVRGRNRYSLPQVESNDRDYWLISRNRTFKEYFLVENREKTQFDRNLYNSGLLIYHIDDSVVTARRASNAVNNDGTGWKYGVALEQADGSDHLFSGANRGDANDPWPGGLSRTTFDSISTTPNSRTNYPSAATLISGCLAKNIPAAGGTMACSLSSGVVGAFTGGPDASGYRWIDSDTTGGPAYAWNDITGTGTLLGNGDDARWQVSLPYNFNFYGTSYNTIWVCTNGWISLGADPGTNQATNTAIPNAAAPNPAIYAFWDDLNLVGSDSGYVYYRNQGASPNCSTTVMWKNARIKGASTYNQATFEAVLYEGGRVQLRYRDAAVSDTNYNWGRSASVGIENATGAVGLQYLYGGNPKGNLLENVRTIQFSLPVVAHDVGVTAIAAPAGIVDSGTVVTPACSAYNYGSSTENYTVRMKIGAGYNNTASVSSHAGGAYVYVTFPSWTAVTRGSNAMSCSTELATDAQKGNDKKTGTVTVGVHDVGATAIKAPAAAIDSGTVVTPACSLYNYGTASENYTARMKIGASYNNTASVSSHAGGAYVYVTFPNWTANFARGSYAVSCSTELTGDMTPANDKKTGTVTVAVHDVGATAIKAPTGAIDSGAVVTPACSLYNYGTASENYTARMKIGSSYNSTASVSGHAAGAYVYITFPTWTALPRGSIALSCSTELATDVQRPNDKKTGTVTVGVHDVGATAIKAPAAAIDSGTVVTPACSLYNYGTASESYTARMKIGASYNSTASVSGHAAGAYIYVTFPNWTAVTRGSNAMSCSTELATDAQKGNDKKTGTVTVGVHDVGATAIKAPTGAVDSGTVVTPACSLYNYGTASESYTARMKIGASYSSTASVSGHAAGAYVYVTFPNWTAVTRGSNAMSCSTELATDAQKGNDKKTGTVTVGVHDVGATAIKAPSGAIDSGTVVTPGCSLYNYGTASESYTARMKIGSSYNSTASVSGHTNGAYIYVTFPTWTDGPRGSIALSCSTELATDMQRPNDKKTGTVTVAVHDVGCTKIQSPRGILDSNTVVTPACSLYNYGTASENYTARMKIGSSYNSTVSVSGHTNGVYVYVTFPNWTIQMPPSTYPVSCSTELASDMAPANDKRTGSVTVVRPSGDNVGCTRILVPTGAIDSGAATAPACSVYNFGNQTEAYSVRMKIGGAYNATATVSTHAPGTSAYATFPSWVALPRGNLAVSCSTELAGDGNPANDRQTDSVMVRVEDAEVLGITGPTDGLVDSGATVAPSATIRNNGTASATFDVRFDIAGWSSTKSVTLAAGGQQPVNFDPWTATQRGTFGSKCTTLLSGDLVPANDFKTGTVTVQVHDVAAEAIVAPTGTIGPGPVTPQGTVHNYGTDREAVDVTFIITGPSPYARTVNLPNGLPLADDTVIGFPSWTATAGSYTARCSTCLAGDAIHTNDAKGGSFTVTAAAPETGWVRKADLPLGPKSKRVKDGGALAYSNSSDLSDGSDASYIYALKGNNRCEFYRYNTADNTWDTKDSIPAIGASGKKKAVKKGAAMTATGDNIYAAKGNNCLEFWLYNPSYRSYSSYAWTQKADVPTGAKNIKEGAGAVSVTAGDSDYVYFLKGSGTQEFYRYSPMPNLWEMRDNAPLGASNKTWKNGSCLAYDGANTIYALKGSYNEFFAYNVDSNKWTSLTSLPLIGAGGKKKKVKDGAGLAYRAGRVYAQKGGNTYEFWTYAVDSHKWVQGPDVPLGSGKKVKGGGTLVYATGPNALYEFKGNNTFDFFKYCFPAIADGSRLSAGGPHILSNSQLEARNLKLSVAPNPFTSTTTINYTLPSSGNVSLKLYDVTGTLVTTLASGYHNAGTSSFLVPRSSLSSGIYLLKFAADGNTITTKLIIE